MKENPYKTPEHADERAAAAQPVDHRPGRALGVGFGVGVLGGIVLGALCATGIRVAEHVLVGYTYDYGLPWWAPLWSGTFVGMVYGLLFGSLVGSWSRTNRRPPELFAAAFAGGLPLFVICLFYLGSPIGFSSWIAGTSIMVFGGGLLGALLSVAIYRLVWRPKMFGPLGDPPST